jgi:hypothetical protein
MKLPAHELFPHPIEHLWDVHRGNAFGMRQVELRSTLFLERIQAMKSIQPFWHTDLPEVARNLVDAGYLQVCQPRDCPIAVEGFLDFDEKRIVAGIQLKDTLASIAALACAYVPWNEPSSSETAAYVATHFDAMREHEQTGSIIVQWLMNEWNKARLAEATNWPNYEVGLHLVDLDVVLGDRRSEPSPFIGHAFTLRGHVRDFAALLSEIAGAVFSLEPFGSEGEFSGPMLWADRQSEHTTADIILYLTPFDVWKHGHCEEFLNLVGRIPQVAIERHQERTCMSGDAIPLFGVDEGNDSNTIPLRFLMPRWWDNQVFASIASRRFLDLGASGRIPLDSKTATIDTKWFGQFTATNALFWFGTPEEHQAMIQNQHGG